MTSQYCAVCGEVSWHVLHVPLSSEWSGIKLPSGRSAHFFVPKEISPSRSAADVAPAVIGTTLGLVLYTARCGILAAVKAYNRVARPLGVTEMRVDE